MKYKIAVEKGKKGKCSANLHGTIIIGLQKGYTNFKLEKQAVLRVLGALQQRLPQISFVVKDAIVAYSYTKKDQIFFEQEPVLELSSDKSPLYSTDMTDKEWKDLFISYAEKLGESFEQFRMYITFSVVESIILERQE